MKKILIVLLFVVSINTLAQNKKVIFVDDKQDYVLLIDKDIQTATRLIEGTEVDLFVKSYKDDFHFTMLISKIYDHQFTLGNLLNATYEEYFLSTCACEILDKVIVYHNNLETLRYKIKAVKNDSTYIGFSESFVSGQILYNILFLTFEGKMENEENEFTQIMSTLIINGKTTINEYKEYETAD
jgi:predicted metal-dependent hydrolase